MALEKRSVRVIVAQLSKHQKVAEAGEAGEAKRNVPIVVATNSVYLPPKIGVLIEV
jgi:hypothetical protein